MIKEELIRANRYEDVIMVLNDIIKESDYDYPLVHPVVSHPIIDSKSIQYRIHGDTVRKEANHLIEVITTNTLHETTMDDFHSIYDFISDREDMYLHNYAVHKSHRSEDSDVDEELLEKARIYMIISNMLICSWNDSPDDGDHEWTIPIGWEKIISFN